MREKQNIIANSVPVWQ